MHDPIPRVAIVDYGLGNLYSVARACERVGLDARITNEKSEILAADCVILPGVGAFGDAMANLHQLDLVAPLREIAQSDTPLIGICLGQQLLMSESEEFGNFKGLDIIPGDVVHFGQPQGPQGALKVPQVGWNKIHPPGTDGDKSWDSTLLSGISAGTYMYFVHSYYIRPASAEVALSISRYGNVEFCSAVRWRNVTAFQYHPERSGIDGIRIYQNLATEIQSRREQQEFRYAA